MKRSILLLPLIFLLTGPVWALDANISHAKFKSSSGNYVEVYLHVVGKTAEFLKVTDSTMQAAVEVVILFKKGEEIIKFDKYLLNSPVFDQPEDFVDMKRYGLENGEYLIEVSVNDVNRPGNTRKYEQQFSMNFTGEQVQQSDIQLLASVKKVDEEVGDLPFIKNGYYFESLPSHYYDKYSELLIFYNEIYDTDRVIGENFMVSYFIEKLEGEQKSGPIGLTHKRREAASVVPLLLQMDIVNLESGNYRLVVQVKDRTGATLGKQSVAFQRSNPYLNVSRDDIASGTNSLDEEFVADMTEQELRYGLKAIAMQVDRTDGELLNTIIKEKKLDAMRLYLFSFWAQENPTNPEAQYEAYMNVARKIDERFQSGFGYGFETDRGYIFMKYGAPTDAVTVETDPSAPPYEIWFYNQFPQTSQNNVKFLFYNPSLSTNGFILLHSTARGEVNNPRWEVDLYRNAPNELDGDNYIDGTRMQGNTGRHARRLFESF